MNFSERSFYVQTRHLQFTRINNIHAGSSVDHVSDITLSSVSDLIQVSHSPNEYSVRGSTMTATIHDGHKP